MRVKMSKPPPPAPIASAIGPCPTVIKIVGRPGTGSLPSTIAPPPTLETTSNQIVCNKTNDDQPEVVSWSFDLLDLVTEIDSEFVTDSQASGTNDAMALNACLMMF